MKLLHLDIEGGDYTLYNNGTVISNKPGPKRYGKKINHRLGTDGYIEVKLNNVYKKLHRLLAVTFVENPDGLPQVNHIDGDKRNNKLSNLEWCTQQYNLHDAMDRGVHNWGRTAIVARSINTGERMKFKSQADASRFLNIQQSNINKVLNNIRPQTEGYGFIYA